MQAIFEIIDGPLPDYIMVADVFFMLFGAFGIGLMLGHMIGKGGR
jgi:hypothetical protein